MDDYDELHERLLVTSSSREIQSERRANEARIAELQERNRRLAGEVLRRIAEGSI